MDRASSVAHHTLDDLTALAAEAFRKPITTKKKSRKKSTPHCDSKTAEERDALIRKLMGPLWGMAWRLACPDHDLAEELRAHVLFKCELGRYTAGKGKFAAWVRTVMTRHLITLLQSKGRATGGDDPHAERVDTRISAAGENDARTTPFPAADLKRILRWSPLKRVLLLTRALLWRKMPLALWVNALASVGLPQTFPGHEFEDMDLAERNAFLARAFGVRLNTIHARMSPKRWGKHLFALQFVRDLDAER